MSSTPLLEVSDLHVSVEGREILKGVTLSVGLGEIHAIMGPNGSGKSTLSYAILGHPRYVVTRGEIRFEGQPITALKTDERARKGLFLAMQYPSAVPGVSVGNFLKSALKHTRGAELPVKEFRTRITERMKALEMAPAFLARYLNDGFSGGEKKRNEILQMTLLEPKLALLDETDSGLDIDALRLVAEGIAKWASPANAILLITHYQRILKYVKPGFVHVLADGRVIRSGGPELAEALEAKGYDWVLKPAAAGA